MSLIKSLLVKTLTTENFVGLSKSTKIHVKCNILQINEIFNLLKIKGINYNNFINSFADITNLPYFVYIKTSDSKKKNLPLHFSPSLFSDSDTLIYIFISELFCAEFIVKSKIIVNDLRKIEASYDVINFKISIGGYLKFLLSGSQFDGLEWSRLVFTNNVIYAINPLTTLEILTDDSLNLRDTTIKKTVITKLGSILADDKNMKVKKLLLKSGLVIELTTTRYWFGKINSYVISSVGDQKIATRTIITNNENKMVIGFKITGTGNITDVDMPVSIETSGEHALTSTSSEHALTSTSGKMSAWKVALDEAGNTVLVNLIFDITHDKIGTYTNLKYRLSGAFCAKIIKFYYKKCCHPECDSYAFISPYKESLDLLCHDHCPRDTTNYYIVYDAKMPSLALSYTQASTFKYILGSYLYEPMFSVFPKENLFGIHVFLTPYEAIRYISQSYLFDVEIPDHYKFMMLSF